MRLTAGGYKDSAILDLYRHIYNILNLYVVIKVVFSYMMAGQLKINLDLPPKWHCKQEQIIEYRHAYHTCTFGCESDVIAT